MASQTPVTLDITQPQPVSYCVPLWVRDEQVRANTARIKARIQPHYALRDAPIAVVGFGPSLNDTWKQVKDFQYVITCSGAHKFLVDRGIVPTWHLDVDPRPHKVTLMGTPHPDVTYLIASACSPKLFDHLEAHHATIVLWHIFDSAEEGFRTLPHGEWAITGGCSAGLRAMTMARFLGFTDLHLFGLDGSTGKSGKHAAAHPMQAKQFMTTVYDGVTYETTPAFLEAARGTFHELDQMGDVRATFYGNGLVQHMAKGYTPKKHQKGTPEIAFVKESLISSEYKTLNAQLHAQNIAYGVGGGKHAPVVLKMAATLKNPSILDYGCGKGYLAKEIPFPIWEYDPAIPGKDASPRPADLVVCSDVLEHIEPDRLPYVLTDLKRVVKHLGYFVIHVGPAAKTLPDGRNTHLIQQPKAWWDAQLSAYFTIGKVFERGAELYYIVAPLPGKPKLVLSAGPRVMLNFDRLSFRRDPYVIGAAADVLEPALYRALADSFPPLEMFKAFGGGNRKWSLSTVNNPDQYAGFLKGDDLWRAFARYIKDPLFIEQMRMVLKTHGLQPLEVEVPLKARFEFSMLPADGGCLRPHTDLPSKLVTLVVSMLPKMDDWDRVWGGGTDVLKPKPGSPPLDDYRADLDAFDVVETYAYVPNQCVVFVKTADSWHSVGPLGGPEGALRKTLTINIERAG